MPLQVTRDVHATTLRIPSFVYHQAKQFVEADETSAGSLNDFFVNAIQAYVKLCERRRIDAEFKKMADDTEYQKEALLVAGKFAASDWEALEVAAVKLAPAPALPQHGVSSRQVKTR